MIRRTRRLLANAAVVAGAVGAAIVLVAGSAGAQGGTVTGSKALGTDSVACAGTVPVTVTLNGVDGLSKHPADVMLVLDRSGSMTTALPELKKAAKTFVNIIDKSSDGALDGTITGSRVGVVSFNSSATLNRGLSHSVVGIKAAINALVAGGTTNHAPAINLAQSKYTRTNNKMIMFTDGVPYPSSRTPAANTAAHNARAAGTEIYVIGLGKINPTQLNTWSTNPDSQHVFITPTSSGLTSAFSAVGADIAEPAATDVRVVDTVDGNFSIANPAVTKGSVSVTGNVITWTIPELRTETVTLTFDAVHNGGLGGTLHVNPTVNYSDAQMHVVTFANPTVDVTGCAPTATCEETNNPSGDNVPPAEQVNRDGFYVLGGTDQQDATGMRVWITDTDSDARFGPYDPGTKIKLRQAPDSDPSVRPGNDTQDTDYFVTLKGDGMVTAVDSSGNASDAVTCYVPPKPQ